MRAALAPEPAPPGPATSAQFTAGNGEYLSMWSNASICFGNIPWTIGGWVYQHSIAGTQVVMAKRGAVDVDYQIYTDGSGKILLTAYNGTGYPVASTSFPVANLWRFVVGSYNGAGTLSIQVDNGTLASVASGTPVDSTASLGFGGDVSGPTDFYGGRLQHWFLFARALNATDRTYLYNSGTGHHYAELDETFKTGLRAWWQFDELSGNRTDIHGGNVLMDHNTVGSAPGLEY